MDSGENPTPEDAYDEMADTYERETEKNLYNAEIKFPGTTDLVPDVTGDRVLDAGCGAGRYTEWLLERGADVVSVDVSEEMLDRARHRVGDRARLSSLRAPDLRLRHGRRSVAPASDRRTTPRTALRHRMGALVIEEVEASVE